jgi:hypothetical protein
MDNRHSMSGWKGDPDMKIFQITKGIAFIEVLVLLASCGVGGNAENPNSFDNNGHTGSDSGGNTNGGTTGAGSTASQPAGSQPMATSSTAGRVNVALHARV